MLEQLYGRGQVEKATIETRFGEQFDVHFADELARLGDLESDGLVECSAARIQLTFPLGRLILRVVAAVFDAYLARQTTLLDSVPLASRVG